MAAITDIDIANQALAMISARNRINAFTDNTVEGVNVNIFYNRVRNQVMAMAPWNFCRRTELLSFLKSAPGTPENPTGSVPWSSQQPAPPWQYEFRYPNDCVFFRYLTWQPNAQIGVGSPPLTTAILAADTWWPGPPQKFIVAQDFNVSATITSITGTVTTTIIANNSFVNGDRITIADVIGSVGLNANSYLVTARTPTQFTITDLNGNPVAGSDIGAYVSGGHALAGPIKCILTNVEFAVGVYNALVVDPTVWPEQFVNAFATALAAFLVFPITGKQELKNDFLGEANAMIIEARKTDGNEGMMIQDHTPDWMRVRGLNYPQWWASEWIAPWPSLFNMSAVG